MIGFLPHKARIPTAYPFPEKSSLPLLLTNLSILFVKKKNQRENVYTVVATVSSSRALGLLELLFYTVVRSLAWILGIRLRGLLNSTMCL